MHPHMFGPPNLEGEIPLARVLRGVPHFVSPVLRILSASHYLGTNRPEMRPMVCPTAAAVLNQPVGNRPATPAHLQELTSSQLH